MKQLITLLCFLVIGVSLKAQQSFGCTTFNSTCLLTTGAVVDTMTYGPTASAYSVITIQPTVTKTSGTIAGTMVLYAKILSTDSYTATGDTLTLTNVATNSTLWNKPTAARYFRIITTGTGTMVGTTKATISGNNQ